MIIGVNYNEPDATSYESVYVHGNTNQKFSGHGSPKADLIAALQYVDANREPDEPCMFSSSYDNFLMDGGDFGGLENLL